MTKLVNVKTNGPVALKVVLRGSIFAVTLTTDEIFQCICQKAIVEEILPSGKTVLLTLSNYNTDNDTVAEKAKANAAKLLADAQAAAAAKKIADDKAAADKKAADDALKAKADAEEAALEAEIAKEDAAKKAATQTTKDTVATTSK